MGARLAGKKRPISSSSRISAPTSASDIASGKPPSRITRRQSLALACGSSRGPSATLDVKRAAPMRQPGTGKAAKGGRPSENDNGFKTSGPATSYLVGTASVAIAAELGYFGGYK